MKIVAIEECCDKCSRPTFLLPYKCVGNMWKLSGCVLIWMCLSLIFQLRILL